MISNCLKKKITVYYLGEDGYLNCFVVNYNFDKEISIAKIYDSYYQIVNQKKINEN